MSRLEKIKSRLLMPIIGLLLAVTAVLTPITAGDFVYAEPGESSENTSTEENTGNTGENQSGANGENNESGENSGENSENTSDDSENKDNKDEDKEEGATCYSQVGALGWLLCPATGLLAKGIDFLYSLIEELLIVRPVDMESNSPVYTVWGYLKDVTNVIFVIFLLVIIYSQITGLGINNYGIKKALPKLIITAVLVNLSYIICAIAVDVSNIVGSSLREFLASVGENAISSGSLDPSISVNLYDLFVAIAGAGVIAGLGIAVAGGAMQLLLALIPIILGGIIAVLIGLATISLRQALIIVLVVISPLAFVAYLLPNTEKWYKKWLNMFVQMLVFYPMFSLLFGMSRLAGWLFIAGSNSALGVILGVAIQILPLFLAISMMKMSGTALGAVSGMMSRLGGKATGAARGYISPYKDAKRAEQMAKAAQKPMNMFSGGAWGARRARQVYRLQDRQRLAQENLQNLNEEQVAALKRGTRVIGYDQKTGEAIYTQRPLSIQSGLRAGKITNKDIEHAMTLEAENRAIKLRLTGAKLAVDNVHNVMGDYLKENGVKKGKIVGKSSQNGEYFFRIDQATREKQNQDLADQRYVLGRYQHAMERNPKTGELIREGEYNKVIKAHLGADGFGVNKLTAEGKKDAFVSENNFTGAITQSSDALHSGNTQRFQAYLNRQVTQVVDKFYEKSLKNRDTDSIIAATSTLAMRGDYDKVKAGLIPYFNEGNVDLTSDAANRLAFHFLQMKDGDPSLARFGKFINMETWAYTSGRRQEQKVTYDQFDTGYVQVTNPDGSKGFLYETDGDGNVKTKDGEPILYKTKVNLATALEGTKLTNIDRTFYGSLEEELRNITKDKLPDSVDLKQYRKSIEDAMMPQVVSALPTFLSGSEQIRTMVGHLVGMKYKDGNWVDTIMSDSKLSDEQKRMEIELMKDTYTTYLKALTPRNLIDIKTDTWNALNDRIMHDALSFKEKFAHDVIADDGSTIPSGTEVDKSNAEEYAHAVLRDILAPQIEKLAAGSWSLENMKLKPLKALRIDQLREERRSGGNGGGAGPDNTPYNGPTNGPTDGPSGTPAGGDQQPVGPQPQQPAGSQPQQGGNQQQPQPQGNPQPQGGGGNGGFDGPNGGGNGGGSTGGTGAGTAGAAGDRNLLQVLNELLVTNKDTNTVVKEFMSALRAENSDATEGDSIAETLAEMKENETDERKIRLLQAILDALQGGDDDLPRHPNDPVT